MVYNGKARTVPSNPAQPQTVALEHPNTTRDREDDGGKRPDFFLPVSQSWN